MRYYLIEKVLYVEAIVAVQDAEEAEKLSSGICASIEDENACLLPENGEPLVAFTASSYTFETSITECDEDGNPLEEVSTL